MMVRPFAQLVGVKKDTITNIEKGKFSEGSKRPFTLRKIREALEPYVIFVDAVPGEHGPGVLLKEGIAIDKIGKNGSSSDGIEEGQISASWQQEGWGESPEGIVVSVQFAEN